MVPRLDGKEQVQPDAGALALALSNSRDPELQSESSAPGPLLPAFVAWAAGVQGPESLV